MNLLIRYTNGDGGAQEARVASDHPDLRHAADDINLNGFMLREGHWVSPFSVQSIQAV